MIFHLVLFKLKKDNSEEVLENFFVGLKSLCVLGGVLSLKVNTINNGFYAGYDNRTKGYTHSLLVTLKDKHALEKYDKDHFHGIVKQTIVKPALDLTQENPVLAVDWEEADPASKLLAMASLSAAAGVVALVGLLALRYRSRL
mmetsp:Transcript_17032/g.37872  ORF Transcript_17032/g.37872 Transcript_17032/m.37872 type:complete len:143 (-) Transcript_17032:58-486(-)